MSHTRDDIKAVPPFTTLNTLWPSNVIDERQGMGVGLSVQKTDADRRDKPRRHAEHARADRLDAEPPRPGHARQLSKIGMRRHDVVNANRKPRYDSGHRAAFRRALPENAEHEYGEETGRRKRKRRPHEKQDVACVQRGDI